MILLAIDTALENCSVGLSAGGRTWLNEATIGRGHAEALLPAISALIDEARIRPADIERIAVTVGPGSFTGLRVGISAARGMALVTGAAVVGVSTLAAHAELARLEFARSELRRSDGQDSDVLALLPARGEVLYGQRFTASAEPLAPARLDAIQAFRDEAVRRKLALCGAGAAAIDDVAKPLHLRSAPSIAAVLSLGARLDPGAHPPQPLYVRPPDATPQAHFAVARR